MPTASIILAAHNAGRTIDRSLDALLSQTFQDFEVIVVEDGSTDDTADVLEKYVDHHQVTVIQQRRRGLAGARNTGINAARGKFIGLCSADELWLPEKLQVHIDHLRSQKTVGISYSKRPNTGQAAPSGAPGCGGSFALDDGLDTFKGNPMRNGSAPVIRKQVLEAIAHRPTTERRRDWYFNETFQRSEEVELWMKIAQNTDWAFECVAGQLTQSQSATTTRPLAQPRANPMLRNYSPLTPALLKRHEAAARAYQLSHLSRQSSGKNAVSAAAELLSSSIEQSWRSLPDEPCNMLLATA